MSRRAWGVGARRPQPPARTAPEPAGPVHTWRIDLPGYNRPPLSLNSRTHWSTRYRTEQQLQQIAAWQAATLRIPRQDVPVTVQLVWEHKPDHRERDGDNTIATTKPIVDGLRHVGVLTSDSHRQVTHGPPLIQPTGRQCIALLLHGTN